MKAKYYTYRNLNRGLSFSTKHYGVVVSRSFDPVCFNDVEFRVSSAGRDRCISTKKRNVHAFIVSDILPNRIEITPERVAADWVEVKYNPYVRSDFYNVDTNEDVKYATRVLLFCGKAYVERNNDS